MTLPYSTIFSEFLHMVDDVQFLSLDESDATAFMNDYLKAALSNVRIQHLFSSKSYDPEIQTFTFELKNPSEDEQGDLDFVTEVLATGMVAAWLKPMVDSTKNTKQIFGGKEEKFYSQSSHLAELRGLYDDAKISLNKMLRDRGYINNSYIREQQ